MANQSSSKYSSIARPYALAAFEYARDKNELSTWKTFLESAKEIAEDSRTSRLLNNPQISPEMLLSLFEDLLKTQLNAERRNLLQLLAQNKRLSILPIISDTFDDLYATLKKISQVKIVTATKLTNEYEQKLAAALSKRTGRAVTLESEVNPSILGGAVIHIGDRVIDGSIRGKLTRLYQSLTD